MVQVAFSRATEQVIHGRSRWHQRSALTPSPADRVEYDAPHCGEDRRERGQAALEAARRADPEESPHPEAEIERASMHEQPLQHALVTADVRAAKPAGLVEMRARSLEQFPASAEQPFAAVAANAAAIRVTRLPVQLLDHSTTAARVRVR
jgi:hypothetical protein